jgi:TonB family protein
MATATELQLLPDVVDAHAPSRRRESSLVSLVLHLAFVIFVLANPKVLRVFQPESLSPELAEELARRQLTLLYIPSDLLKIPEPKKEELTPEERRRAVVRTPFTLDPRELRRILPAPVVPPPPQETESPGLEAERFADRGEPKRGEGGEAEERRGQTGQERRRELARLENLPERSSPSPKLEIPSGTAGRMIEESLRGMQQGRQPGTGGDAGGALPSLPNLNTPFPLILSDTRGVDFGPYLTRLLYDVKKNWYAVMPEAARLGRRGRVVIVFRILKDGGVPPDEPALVRSSDFLPFDRAAYGAIRAAQPFPALPPEFTGEHIILQFTFLYNLPLDYHEP